MMYGTKNVITLDSLEKQQQVFDSQSLCFQVWIDHCTFSNIGRQMIVAGGTSPGEGNSGITISNNLFSGKTKWSARCQK